MPTEKKKKANVHDAFFRRAMVNPKLCKGLLQMIMPKQERELFDLDTLRAEMGTFIDKNLKEHRTDFVVSLKFKGSEKKANIFFVIEHKSYRDDRVLIQLFEVSGRSLCKRTLQEGKDSCLPDSGLSGEKAMGFFRKFSRFPTDRYPFFC